MPDLTLDLRYLRYALAVAELGSFRRAAAKLDVPQSTVSRRVSLLEARIGISIFDRDHKGVRLTLGGQRFIDEAVVGAQHFTNALGAIGAIRRGHQGSLRVGMFASLRSGFLRSLIDQYHHRYPEVECHFEEGTAQSAVGSVLDGRLDIAFVTGDPVAPRCHSISLWEERLFVVLRRDHRLSSAGDIQLSLLREDRFIVTGSGRGPEIEDFLLAKLSQPGSRPDVHVHAVSRETLLNMVELGFGIAIVTESAVTRHGVLAFRGLSGSDTTVKSSAIWLSSNTNPALRSMIDLARQRVSA